MKIFWFIPTHGDSRYLGTSKGARQVDHAYMKPWIIWVMKVF